MVLTVCVVGCGKLVAPVDIYGFNEAFEERVEPAKGAKPIGDESIKLADDVLNAVYDHDLDMALSKLESLRKQDDLSPRQRIETKSLHTAVVNYLGGSKNANSPQNAGTNSPQPAG